MKKTKKQTNTIPRPQNQQSFNIWLPITIYIYHKLNNTYNIYPPSLTLYTDSHVHMHIHIGEHAQTHIGIK